ncbi:MAG TPA: undecaprenyl-diphosphate phosphatase [Candidatus Tumulicola sp.]|nr:undecaprenyl-diphosphate phosphatase [Candidatus Tumulicola sp.]
MSIVQAIALGLIQGVAELFPISSAAHTLLISALLGWTPPSLPFVVMLHFGTFLAVLVYFARDFWQLVVGFFTGFVQRFAHPYQRLALLIVTGSIPLAILGWLLEKRLEPLFGKPLFAAVCLLVTGLVLFAVERLPQGSGVAERLPFWRAFWVGVSQVAGLVPGGSRSGFSIAAGMLAGLTREQAARFSFLLAGPAILGATIFELRKIVHHTPGAAAAEPTQSIAIGFIVAFVSGLIAIRFFMRFVDQHRLTPFAVYCWVFGLAMIGVFLLRAHHGA